MCLLHAYTGIDPLQKNILKMRVRKSERRPLQPKLTVVRTKQAGSVKPASRRRRSARHAGPEVQAGRQLAHCELA